MEGYSTESDTRNPDSPASTRGVRPPTVRLPPGVGAALDSVTDADRAWFEAHPGCRWRVRPAAPIEWRAHELVGLMAQDSGCPGCPDCAPYMLVLVAPSLNIRVRHPFAGDPFRDPDAIWPGAARTALAARTDEAFVEALLPYTRPIGRKDVR